MSHFVVQLCLGSATVLFLLEILRIKYSFA